MVFAMTDYERRWLYKHDNGQEFELWAKDEKHAISVLRHFAITNPRIENLILLEAGPSDVMPIE